MGDHTEAISIDYDPQLISYNDLLGHFWNAHRCERNNSSRPYMNAVFYQNATYPDAKSLADSTVATRLNAYLGTGMDKDWKIFLEELPSYGLPENLEKRLEKAAQQKR